MKSYRFDDFLRHWGDWGMVRDYGHITVGNTTASIGAEHDFTSSYLRARDYMQQLYGDTDEAADKAKLFCEIQMYIAQHAKQFDRGALAVCGTEHGLISQHLLKAVHHFFTLQPLSTMKAEPAVADVIRMAQTYASSGDAST